MEMKGERVTLAVTPQGEVVVRADADAPWVDGEVAARVREAFGRGMGAGLVQLGTAEVEARLPAVMAYWREWAGRYVGAVCARGDDAAGAAVPGPEEAAREAFARGVPPMAGAEYVTAEMLAGVWGEIDEAFREEARKSGGVAAMLRARHAAWHLVGRVHFNLAENRGDDDAPFAFLATYTTRLTRAARAQHVPLGQALREYAGARAKAELAALLQPVRLAADACPWLGAMVDSGEIFHPLRWTPGEALRMLADAGKLEQAGVIVRMPAQWRGGRPARVKAGATVGGDPPAGFGGDALLDFRSSVTLDGEPLSDDEIAELLAGAEGLRMLRGRWVELDREKLQETIERLRAVERLAEGGGLGFAEAMRMVAGAAIGGGPAAAATPDAHIVAGAWLGARLAELRHPEALAEIDPGEALHADLRPYQQVGVRWLYVLAELGMGACLADDMGLGKTMQVIALLLARRRRGGARVPALIVAPASLLGNWTAEVERFAPSLRVVVAHPSAMAAESLAAEEPPPLDGVDLVITSYGTLARAPWLGAAAWDLAIVDEAQAIKNPSTRQARAVKTLRARARIALTGTPIENRLGDLWSIFDFLNPGLLGGAKEFTRFTKELDERGNGYGPLRELIRPYVLRRLKTDRTVIADLPDKTEVVAYCALSRKQAALYQQAVDDLAARLAASPESGPERGGALPASPVGRGQGPRGIERRGVVLASLTRLKQICNHPSQWLGDGGWAERDSGKLARVREIAEVIAAKQEKLLVFSQFRETVAPLAAFLAEVFGRPGLILHGNTAVGGRSKLVKQFQEDPDVPFFVLSLKAGGTGLNLTAASHVLHFDRWWNPAVEDQATDRAFRIGQKRNVLVHKLVCRGTVEEKIDALITGKRGLAQQLLLGGADEVPLTELSDGELLDLVALDLGRAMAAGDGARGAA